MWMIDQGVGGEDGEDSINIGGSQEGGWYQHVIGNVKETIPL